MNTNPSKGQLISSWSVLIGAFLLMHFGHLVLAMVLFIPLILIRPDKRGYDSSTGEFFEKHTVFRRFTYFYYFVLVVSVIFNTDIIQKQIMPNKEMWSLLVLAMLGPVLIAVASTEIQLFRQAK